MTDVLYPKIIHKFICEYCSYKCSKKSILNKHFLTQKHIILSNTNEKSTKIVAEKLYTCCCGKIYKHNQSLYNHKKKCNFKEEQNKIVEQNKIEEQKEENKDYKLLFMQLLKDNAEFKNLLIEQHQQSLEQHQKQHQQSLEQSIVNQNKLCELIPKMGNTTNNTTNNHFNLNLFLEEYCKDAISIDEFLKNIEITIRNILITKDKGFCTGMSTIFIENMNKLSLYERPMHCTDKKRETIYIKKIIEGTTNSKWEKDENNKKTISTLEKIAHNQLIQIDDWTDENPNYETVDKLQDDYIDIINKMSKSVIDNKEKILKKVCENIFIDKGVISSN